jgi:hypothetical protein
MNFFKKYYIIIFFVLNSYGMEFLDKNALVQETTNIIGNNIDDIVLKGIEHIKDNGELLKREQALDSKPMMLIIP